MDLFLFLFEQILTFPLSRCYQRIPSTKSVSNFTQGVIFYRYPTFLNFLLTSRHFVVLSHLIFHFFSSSLSPPPVEEITEYPDFVETNQISGAGNMLKTLDPILITIIAMSALGVFLGAICGVVLYCACSHGGMSDRNLSALENYNFELVDGVKLKKDKLNVQSSYTEA